MWVKTYIDDLVNIDHFDTIDIKDRPDGLYSLTATLIRPTAFRKGVPPVPQSTYIRLLISKNRYSCEQAQGAIEERLARNINFTDLSSYVIAERSNEDVD